MMMDVYYEHTIDTIDDVLSSDRTVMVTKDSILRHLLMSDPRMKVKKLLAERVSFYELGTGSLHGDLGNVYQG